MLTSKTHQQALKQEQGYKEGILPVVETNKTSRESKMVHVTLADGKPGWCDPEIKDMVQALNDLGLQTIASCSGHGHRPATIALADGREILILRNYSEARQVGRLFHGINGEKPKSIIKEL